MELKAPQFRISFVRSWLMNSQPVLLLIGAKMAPKARMENTSDTSDHLGPSNVTMSNWLFMMANITAG
ncbi:hypothetical protein ACVOMV_25505 [Mesorhizobium atlanticum]